MKKLFNKSKGLIKGRSTAFLVSAGIHVALIILAGTFVVFNIVKQPPVKFEPVKKLDRPTIKLKKLQVKVKENSRPKDSTQRIVAKTTIQKSNIQLPPMSGAAEGLSGGNSLGGFDVLADLADMSIMGSKKSVGNDLVGTFYYFMRSRGGAKNEFAGRPDELYNDRIREFFEADWDPSVFDPYYRSPTKLYATQFFIPGMNSGIAPDKFGFVDREAMAAYWLCHYKGKIGYPESAKKDFPDGTRFRFWGFGDNVMFVRINGELILDASNDRNYGDNLAGWRASADDDNRYTMLSNGGQRWRVSDWFEMTPDETTDMEILFGEQPGGGFMAILCVEQEGVEYPDREGVPGPLLPIFKTSAVPQHIIDEISYYTAPGMVDITGGPIFSVY